MIYYLNGKIQFKNDKTLVIETNGMGYKVFCSAKTLENISEGQSVKLFTYLHLKEAEAELYGFLTQKELELFEILNELSGVGPKTAMTLASLGSLVKLKELMEKGELPKEIKGIGKKKSQKILLELTGKINEIKIVKKTAETDEALDGLVSLGFSKQIAKEALCQIPSDIQTTKDRIKKALEIIGRK
jgi:Holliday junction DNA helicase RuvA